jgi:hypothetical protein
LLIGVFLRKLLGFGDISGLTGLGSTGQSVPGRHLPESKKYGGFGSVIF